MKVSFDFSKWSYTTYKKEVFGLVGQGRGASRYGMGKGN
jgi:hypothetical protein